MSWKPVPGNCGGPLQPGFLRVPLPGTRIVRAVRPEGDEVQCPGPAVQVYPEGAAPVGRSERGIGPDEFPAVEMVGFQGGDIVLSLQLARASGVCRYSGLECIIGAASIRPVGQMCVLARECHEKDRQYCHHIFSHNIIIYESVAIFGACLNFLRYKFQEASGQSLIDKYIPQEP